MTGHVIYNPAYTYKFQLKTTQVELPEYAEGNFGEWKKPNFSLMTLKIQFKIGLIIH